MSPLIASEHRMPRVFLSRCAVVGAVLVCVMAAHWWMPTQPQHWHAAHLILRKLFFVPVVLAAIWFNLRGAILVAGVTTLLYSSHILVQWSGQYHENINQLGELGTIWLTALLAGLLVGMEKRTLRELSDTHEGALLALIGALDAREHDTHLHSLRVRAYALRLGREMGMRGRALEVLGEAALLHDVGKVGVPDRILLKPGALTEGEWNSMREHAQIGGQILDTVPFLRDAAQIVYSHHERFDGAGYPLGLNGNGIPLGARVFAVVDAFDALLSKRPYKETMEYEEARQRIKDGSGTHFDPVVVRAFCNVSKKEWERIAKNVSDTLASHGVRGPRVFNSVTEHNRRRNPECPSLP